MTRNVTMKTGAVGAACLAIGAGGGILGSATAHPGHRDHHLRRGTGPHALLRAVHAEAVVPVRGGTFATVTLDRGFLTARDGARLTLREGTRTATYRTVTVTVPTGATVRRDGKAASLAALATGDRVRVLTRPGRTVVRARAPR